MEEEKKTTAEHRKEIKRRVSRRSMKSNGGEGNGEQ